MSTKPRAKHFDASNRHLFRSRCNRIRTMPGTAWARLMSKEVTKDQDKVNCKLCLMQMARDKELMKTS